LALGAVGLVLIYLFMVNVFAPSLVQPNGKRLFENR